MTATLRRSLAAVLLAGSIGACSHSSTGSLGSTTGGGTAGGGTANAGNGNTNAGNANLAAAAQQVTDACTFLPTDLADQLVPGGSIRPQSSPIPPKCTFSNDNQVLEITIAGYDTGGPVPGAEQVPGLAAGGYLERLTPGEVYLTVLLDPDHGKLYVEMVAGDDGKDHKVDAIAVARRVLSQLG
jgi:hypothetical protein